ncbi:MAG: serine/threonine protein kinase [Polyangiaceae bacterium]|nr:serine/threonine protein kinase [Polyangiaceae bacterium]
MPSGERSPSTLLGRVAVELDSEEGRAFLQERLAFFGLLSTLLSGTFLVVGNGTALLTVPEHTLAIALRDGGGQWHAAALGVSALVWLSTRFGPRSLRALALIDLLANPVAIVFYALMTRSALGQAGMRPDLTLMLVLMTLITARAILVPSRAGQTLVVSVLSTLPALAQSVEIGRRLAEVVPAAWVLGPVTTLLWSASTVVIATVASHTIYGLRVRAAVAQRLGQYELLEKIGEGGMGVVYRARHAMLRRPTAVKLLPPEKAGTTTVSRFEREVRLTARLTHPNTVAVYDYGRTPDGLFYYAMELLDGIDLEHLVRTHGPQPPARVVHVLQQVCGSLAEAHAIGLVHRDIKPANVILCQRGGQSDVAKVVDFGLVKELIPEPTRGAPQLSGVNAIVGTPLYLSPEAVTEPERVDARSDLYALGAVAYFLLTAQPVFAHGSVMEICAAHLHERPVAPSLRLGERLPEDLDELVLACLAKLPAARPASADTLRSALLALDVGAWTERDSARWWQEHAETLHDHLPVARHEDSPTALTVDVGERVLGHGSGRQSDSPQARPARRLGQ